MMTTVLVYFTFLTETRHDKQLHDLFVSLGSVDGYMKYSWIFFYNSRKTSCSSAGCVHVNVLNK